MNTIERIYSNLINGNLDDAKRQAKRVSIHRLNVGFCQLGASSLIAVTAAVYLKRPSNETFQKYCDAK